MSLNKTLLKVTDRIIERSKNSRENYVSIMKLVIERALRREHVGPTLEGANSVL